MLDARKNPPTAGQMWEPPPTLALAVVAASWSTIRPQSRAAGNRHALWVLDYSRTESDLEVRVARPRAPWRPRGARRAHLYRPGTPYWERSASSTPIPAAHILFRSPKGIGLHRLTPDGYACIADPAGNLLPLLETAARAGAGQTGFWLAQSAFCRILEHLETVRPGPDGVWRLPPRERKTALVEAVDNLLCSRLATGIRLRDIAAALHMSPSTLSHRYRREAGTSPGRRLIQLRIEQAKVRLLRGERLATIAAATGFCDPFHLSKTFKKLTGVTPHHFRQ